ncbi:MAG: NAD(P)H-dependent oxidoreductase subunit E [Candidatus Eremiobacteraeota bacterium]|nr:NAD(P)H-dependent oxidoreductase subunit E [Candidatus Eremiobacteraeota bacterium]
MVDAVPERDFAAISARVEPEARRLIAQYPAGNARSALLPILHAFQNVEGWVSPEALARAAEWPGVPLSVVESTASFYTLFHRRPVGRYVLQPCRNLSCMMNGAGDIMRHFRERLGIGHLETTSDGLFSYEESECLAACDRAPCMQVNLEFVYDLTKEKVDALLGAMRDGSFEVPALPQSELPGRDWHVGQDGRKSPGARGVSSPNTPGGLGDSSGVRMIERLERDPYPTQVRPTKERLVTEGAERLSSPTNPSEH